MAILASEVSLGQKTKTIQQPNDTFNETLADPGGLWGPAPTVRFGGPGTQFKTSKNNFRALKP